MVDFCRQVVIESTEKGPYRFRAIRNASFSRGIDFGQMPLDISMHLGRDRRAALKERSPRFSPPRGLFCSPLQSFTEYTPTCMTRRDLCLVTTTLCTRERARASLWQTSHATYTLVTCLYKRPRPLRPLHYSCRARPRGFARNCASAGPKSRHTAPLRLNAFCLPRRQ